MHNSQARARDTLGTHIERRPPPQGPPGQVWAEVLELVRERYREGLVRVTPRLSSRLRLSLDIRPSARLHLVVLEPQGLDLAPSELLPSGFLRIERSGPSQLDKVLCHGGVCAQRLRWEGEVGWRADPRAA